MKMSYQGDILSLPYQRLSSLLFLIASFSVILSMSAVMGDGIEGQQEFVMLDIHIPLEGDSCAAQEVRRFNAELRLGLGSEAIDFDLLHTPHITLYQTIFHVSKLENIKNALDEVVLSSPVSSCLLQWNSKVVSGDFAMLSIDFHHEPTNCLQQLSDIVVTKLLPYVKFPAEVPDWVLNIKDDMVRKRKIELVKHYGSPNVFGGFDPHATVGFDNRNSFQQEILMNGTNLEHECKGYFNTIAIGNVGIGGSVLKGAIYEKELGHSIISTIL